MSKEARPCSCHILLPPLPTLAHTGPNNITSNPCKDLPKERSLPLPVSPAPCPGSHPPQHETQKVSP